LAKLHIWLIKVDLIARAFRGELGTNDPKEENAVELLKEVLIFIKSYRKGDRRIYEN